MHTPPPTPGNRQDLDSGLRSPEATSPTSPTAETLAVTGLPDNRRLSRRGPPNKPVTPREWRPRFVRQASSPGSLQPLSAPRRPDSPTVGKRILIADDDAVVRGSLADAFASEGFVVDEATNGIEAVNFAIVRTPDLVLLDLNMPHWDGWSAFSQLDWVAPLLPVIVITARPDEYENAQRLGIDAFMEKPLNFPILLKAVADLTNEPELSRLRRITDRAFVTQLLGAGND